jgi:phosphonate transport system ATP-binding protein
MTHSNLPVVGKGPIEPFQASSLVIQNLSCRYRSTNNLVLRGIDLCIPKGEQVALLGASGAGKSTLMKCISQLIRPAEGRIVLEGREIWSLKARSSSENHHSIGMIFQEFALIERLTALENVLIGCLGRVAVLPSVLGIYPKQEKAFAIACLEQVGMDRDADQKVQDLSGGQRQRVAIARVLAQRPKVILADEPVSNLDPPLRRRTMQLLTDICLRERISLLVSLHFPDLVAEFTTRTIGLRDGQIIFDRVSDYLTKDDLSHIYGKVES